MYTRDIQYFGERAVVACDGNCAKAWGVQLRPRIVLDENDPDDYAFLADSEVGTAPVDPGTYEGPCGKPPGPHAMNKWCTRQCERSTTVDKGQPIVLEDFTKRQYNQPFKHTATAES